MMIPHFLLQTDMTGLIPDPGKVDDAKSAFAAFEGLSINDALTKIANSAVDFVFKLLIAIVVLYVGKFIIKKLYRLTYNVMVNRDMDPSLTTFVLSLIRIVLYFILIVTVIGILGIETSSFLAIFASAGVAVGMALSGTLQNFAGGVLILLLKPYKVGDYIEAGGYSGTVKAIQIFNTVINTVDNKAIIIPNGGLSTGSINNYSLEGYRRVDWNIGLAYGTDYQAASGYILSMLASDDRIVKEYIEDDEALHKDDEGDADGTECGTAEECGKERKPSWWTRMKLRRKQHRDMINAQLKERINMNAGLPMRVNRAPFVGLNELGDSSINIVVRAWTRAENYWPLYFEMNERFYKELPENGFEFPFPQLDVHLQKSV